MLVYNTEPVNCESVKVEIKGKTFHYLYKNEADGVQGNIWLNGIPLFGYGGADDIGFYLEFYEDLAYPCAWITGKETPGNMITTSADWLTENGWNQYVE